MGGGTAPGEFPILKADPLDTGLQCLTQMSVVALIQPFHQRVWPSGQRVATRSSRMNRRPNSVAIVQSASRMVPVEDSAVTTRTKWLYSFCAVVLSGSLA